MKDEKKNYNPLLNVAFARQKEILFMSKWFKDIDKKIKKKKRKSKLMKLFGLEV